MSVLPTLPPAFATTRDALHQVAFFAIAPKRHAHTGRLGLRAEPGTFGTPRWDDGCVWVDGIELVVASADAESRSPITTVRAATTFLGIGYQPDWFPDFHDPLAPGDPDAVLVIDAEAATALGNWFTFGTDALEGLRAHPDVGESSEVQLWPEHFDAATEIGDADLATKASYGASPGDAGHHEPYLYVAPWSDVDRTDPMWNDAHFAGASLSYNDLAATADPAWTAVEFFLAAHARLRADTQGRP